jgi:hypothetical protein
LGAFVAEPGFRIEQWLPELSLPAVLVEVVVRDSDGYAGLGIGNGGARKLPVDLIVESRHRDVGQKLRAGLWNDLSAGFIKSFRLADTRICPGGGIVDLDKVVTVGQGYGQRHEQRCELILPHEALERTETAEV